MNDIHEFACTLKSGVEEILSGCTISINDVRKNNGLVRTGLTIAKEGNEIAPTIYIDGMYRLYQDGVSEAQLIQKVIDAYEEAYINDTTPIQNALSSFVNAKDRLFIKLINEEKNREMLQDIPHRMVQDLAIVYALHLKDAFDFSGTVTVTNTLLQMWGIDEETLYTQVMLNTPRVSPAILCPLQEMMESLLPTAQFLNAPPMDISEYDFDGFTIKIDNGNDMQLYIVTNKSKIFGAASLLLPHVMEKIGEFLGSFYVLPSSIHEVLVIPASSAMETSELIGMVRQINETELLPEEVLSDNIYLYDKDEKTFSVITE